MRRSLVRVMAGTAVLLYGGLVLQGCKCDISSVRPKKTETDMGSHHVTVKPGSSFTTSSSSALGDHQEHEFTCGEVTVLIQDEELIVGDMSYGTLSEGDSVLLDNGVVYIEGKEVEGKPLSSSEGSGTGLGPTHRSHLLARVTVNRGPSVGDCTTSVFRGILELPFGDNKAVLWGDELVANGKSYGKIPPETTIEVGDTVVRLGGKEVEGEPLSPADLAEMERCLRETTWHVKGYLITVRPSSAIFTITNFMGKDTLTAGRTEVRVKGRQLEVDGKSYGKLGPDDTVLVDYGKVFISGQPRSAE